MNEFEERRVYLFIDIIKQSVFHKFNADKLLFKFLNWNVEQLEAATLATESSLAGLLWDSVANREKNVLHRTMSIAFTFICVIDTPTVPYITHH